MIGVADLLEVSDTAVELADAAERGEVHKPSSMCHLRNVDAYNLKPSGTSCETHLQPVLWQGIVINVMVIAVDS